MHIIIVTILLLQLMMFAFKLTGNSDLSWVTTLSPILLYLLLSVAVSVGSFFIWLIEGFFSLFSGRAKTNIDKQYNEMMLNPPARFDVEIPSKRPEPQKPPGLKPKTIKFY
jgi:CRISPR/Cas system endoribonuclease Cas6 (RAMP superfamily)